MLADPVEGFLAGVTSAPMRILIAAAAVLLGFAVCVLPSGREDWFLAIAMLAFTSIFRWAYFGGWFFLGLCALIGMFAFLHAFVMERVPKFSLFATFTCAATYFAPVTFSDRSWLSAGTWRWSIGLYVGATLTYWILPPVISKLFTNREPR